MAPTYRAFISYSHKDSQWAQWLHRALETYKIPRRPDGLANSNEIPARLYPICFDRAEFPTSNDLGVQVREHLANFRNLVVICSPNSAASAWIDEDVRLFKHLGRADRVFCLIVDGH